MRSYIIKTTYFASDRVDYSKIK